MGNLITNWAKSQQTGGGVAKAILLCLADAAFDSECGRVSMTIPQIVGVIEFSRRTVIDNLLILEERNLIAPREKSKKKDGTNNPNVYQILCPAEIFEKVEEPAVEIEHSAGDAPSQPDLVREMHYHSASPALGEAQKQPEILQTDAQGAGDAPSQHSAGAAPSTVFKEEEFKDKERDNARANTSDNFLTETGEQIEHFPETANLVNREFRLETDRHLHWTQTQQGIKSRRNFPAQEWLDLLQNLSAEGISGDGFREFYQWVEGQSWVEQVAPKLLKTQIGKFNNRAKIAIKKQTGANNDAENKRNQQPTAKSARAQNAINEYHEDAERRARIAQRREAQLQRHSVSDG